MFTIKQGDYTVTKSMRMPQRMIERLERLAAENNVTFTQLVLQCLEYALDNMGPASGEEESMPSGIRWRLRSENTRQY